MKPGKTATSTLLALFCAAATGAHGDSTPVAPTAALCASPAHRAFDFWLGEWDVTTPARQDWRATSSITLSNGGCSLHESYRAPGGYAGRSINFYDVARDTWHQTWIDNQGRPLFLEGQLVDGAMVLSDGSNRITWTVQPDARVRQLWQTTSDGGASWQTVFDGYYRRR
jgi:hypothetical protein